MLQKENVALKRFFVMQLASGILGVLVLLLDGRIEYALSYLYGVALMAANGYWLAGRIAWAGSLSVEAGQRSLYAGAVIRFVSLLVGLVLAHVIGLHLLLVALGMFVAQAVVFITALVGFKREKRDSA